MSSGGLPRLLVSTLCCGVWLLSKLAAQVYTMIYPMIQRCSQVSYSCMFEISEFFVAFMYKVFLSLFFLANLCLKHLSTQLDQPISAISHAARSTNSFRLNVSACYRADSCNCCVRAVPLQAKKPKVGSAST